MLAIPFWVYLVVELMYIGLIAIVATVVWLAIRHFWSKFQAVPVPRTDPNYPVKRGSQ
ncbi:MAG: hypothetical protein GWN12_10125 [Thermoplasmata archaeon]|nr:hypothetical protein [Thermoplasmata archaeon]NIS12391.1 hypothetical protein [Thermoplasmata archaeon]NIS20311.1 hypothetical protein [Thermoplasmata archaeon]NIT77653.1 hypothetical protein [Thermoplasmata archaeon]NIU49399.1 hypothetical protein [Thermoplasmata archaeon]